MKTQMSKFIKSKGNLLFSLFITFIVVGGLQFVFRRAYADPDVFYHARISQLLLNGTWVVKQLPWLVDTTLRTGFADQHFLYHLLFGLFGNAWQVFIIMCALLVAGVFIFVLSKLQVKKQWLWVPLLLLGSADFLFRLSLVKASILGLVLLLLIIWTLIDQKYWLLLSLSTIFVLTYGGFVFIPILVLAWIACESIFTKRFNWQALAWGGGGILLGLLLHPSGAHYLSYLSTQIFQTGIGRSAGIVVGNEWYGYVPLRFLKINALVHGVWMLSIVLYFQGKYQGKKRVINAFLFLLSTVFFLFTLRSVRFVEYWVPFSVLFSAHVLSPYLEKVNFGVVKDHLKKHWQFGAFVLVFLSLISYAVYYNVKTVVGYIQGSPRYDVYQGASNWLIVDSQPGDIVFNAQWDQFPQLFYWNSKDYYIVGLDPTFMYEYNKDLYYSWLRFSEDKPEVLGNFDMHHVLANDFKAKYVFIEKSRNPTLWELLENRPSEFEKGYEDEQAVVFKVK